MATVVEFTGTRRFRVLGRLGEGGMGVVYEAHDRDRDVRVALKTLRRLEPDELLRLKSEFRSLQDVRHPNLVSLGELFEEDGQWFFTMEIVDGVDFLTYVRPGRKKRGSGPATDSLTVPDLPSTVAAEDEHIAIVPGPRSTLEDDDVSFDETRLRSALAELAHALSSLHEAGLVHRDLKPANIVVSNDGRVVVVDFGLADHAQKQQPGTAGHVMGTASYMAPEQATPSPIGPAADMYGLGVILFEALTGRVPLSGTPKDVLEAKQHHRPVPPSVLEPSVPAELDQLTVALLNSDPARRPTANDVLKVLKIDSAQRVNLSPVGPALFVGRSRELRLLAAEADVVRSRGVPSFVAITGESGLGKTSLVRRFRDKLSADADVLFLGGRCFERESVPFKAVDGVIDSIAKHITSLDRDAVARLAPAHADLLPQVFPVLGVFAATKAIDQQLLDPRELRARVFEALRELLSNLAAPHLVVITIDDMQWADDDSYNLLEQLLRQPGAAGILWVVTGEDMTEPLKRLVGNGVHIDLKPLQPAEAEELAAALLDRAPGAEHVSAAVMAMEGAGHPLFVDELVRHALSSPGKSARPIKLDEALWSRICQLDEESRFLLELVSVAGAPFDQEALAVALVCDREELDARVDILRTASLLRTVGSHATDPLEPFHARIRAAILTNIDAETTMRHYDRIARALEATGKGAHGVLAQMWGSSGAVDKAAHYAVRAADRAAAALAFERAADLYLMALHLEFFAGDELRELQGKLGDALANAGQGADAAAAYLAAADGAPSIKSRDLRARAALEFLHGGHIGEGLETLRVVLGEVGMRLPRSPRSALASLAFRRARIRLRGLRFKQRAEKDVPAQLLSRIDICNSVAIGLSFVDIIRGADFQARALLLALKSGEPYRVARAVATEAGFAATRGTRGKRRVSMLLELGEQLGERSGNDHAIGLAMASKALYALLSGRFRVSLDLASRAERIFRDRCTGVTFELDTIHIFALVCLFYSGDIDEMQRRHPLYLNEARQRGDLYLETCLLVGHSNWVFLFEGDVDGARRARRDAMEVWSDHGFHLQHYWSWWAEANIEMFDGNGLAALALVDEGWSEIKSSMLMRIQLVQVESHFLRGRTLLAAGEGDHLVRALADARRLERLADYAKPFGWLIRAAVEHRSGNQSEALDLLMRAENDFDRRDIDLFELVTRSRRGLVLGGDEGIAITAEAEAALRQRGVAAVEQTLDCLAPGFSAG